MQDGHEEFELPELGVAESAGQSSKVSAGSGAARSPMPGVVEKVHVYVLDAVQAGQPLVVIIAMKMEVSLFYSHKSRLITSIHEHRGWGMTPRWGGVK